MIRLLCDQTPGFEQHQKLELRIADDFHELPQDVVDDFWADALNEQPEFVEQAEDALEDKGLARYRLIS